MILQANQQRKTAALVIALRREPRLLFFGKVQVSIATITQLATVINTCNATGMNVQLNEQQRSEIRTTVINAHGAPRVGQVDFDVTVGTVIPRGKVRIVPVPETLVRIEPEWRGFLYFVYEDEVVIVNPNDMKIVAVVPV